VRAIPEYQYGIKAGGDNLFSSLIEAIIRWLSNAMDGSYDGLPDLLFWALVVLVVVLVVFLVARSRRQNIFESASGAKVAVVEEELQAPEDIDRMIGQAQHEGDYRLAIRLLYRRTLAELRNVGHIAYRPEKTDADYIREVRSRAFGSAFASAVRYFQVAWYGMEHAQPEQFAQASAAFDAVRSQIRGNA
jgi:hypothetical protein